MRVATHVGATIASLARATVIAFVAMMCGAAYVVGSIRRLAIRDRDARQHHRAQQRGALLRWALTRLGATPIKIGQVMSSRPDLFSPEVIEALRALQDRVPPFSYRRVRKILSRELGGLDMFRELDREPVAAGSIAQVHRAVLVGGDEVAVKIVRPGVHACVRRDARILLWLAHIAYVVSPRARSADAIGHARSLIAGILGQCDLRHEANNYDRLRADFSITAGLAFPRVYHEHSTRDVLTMEYIHGCRLEDVPPESVPKVARVLRTTFFEMCFEHGLVHADLHPGNLLVRDNGVVVMLDVGLVKQLAPPVIDQVAEFARCMVMGNARELVDHLRINYEHADDTDWNAVAVDAVAFVADLRRRSICELEVSSVVSRLFALARKHRIRPMSELSLVLLGMVTIEGIAKRLDPTANTIAEVAKFLGPRMSRRLARGSLEWPLRSLAPLLPAQAPPPATDQRPIPPVTPAPMLRLPR